MKYPTPNICIPLTPGKPFKGYIPSSCHMLLYNKAYLRELGYPENLGYLYYYSKKHIFNNGSECDIPRSTSLVVKECSCGLIETLNSIYILSDATTLAPHSK